MDGTVSFRAKDEPDRWNPARLKDQYPAALPVFSVNTEQEANALITLACTKSYDSDRHGLPHILDENIDNMEAVGDHLAAAYRRMQTKVKL